MQVRFATSAHLPRIALLHSISPPCCPPEAITLPSGEVKTVCTAYYLETKGEFHLIKKVALNFDIWRLAIFSVTQKISPVTPGATANWPRTGRRLTAKTER